MYVLGVDLYLLNCIAFRVQPISDIISTQIKWNQSNDFTSEPIELMFEVSDVNYV